jgi:hypothetical protein
MTKKVRVNPSGGGPDDDDNTVPDGGPENRDSDPRRGTPPVQDSKPIQVQCVNRGHLVHDLPPLRCPKTPDRGSTRPERPQKIDDIDSNLAADPG